MEGYKLKQHFNANMEFLGKEYFTKNLLLKPEFVKPYGNDYIFVVMLAGSQCGWCHKAAPVFCELNDEFEEEDIPIFTGVVCIDDNQDCPTSFREKLMKKYDTVGVPTFLIFGPDRKFIKKYDGNYLDKKVMRGELEKQYEKSTGNKIETPKIDETKKEEQPKKE